MKIIYENIFFTFKTFTRASVLVLAVSNSRIELVHDINPSFCFNILRLDCSLASSFSTFRPMLEIFSSLDNTLYKKLPLNNQTYTRFGDKALVWLINSVVTSVIFFWTRVRDLWRSEEITWDPLRVLTSLKFGSSTTVDIS